MKKINQLEQKVLLLLLLVAAGVARGQNHEFAPVGAEWHYERLYREGWNYTGVAYDRFRSLRTIEINGWDCKEIELYQHLDCDGLVNPYTELLYITQEGNQIYEVEDGERFLLYDFSKDPGDSWYAPKYGVEVYVIDTSTLVLEDGSIRKILHTFTFDDYIYFTNIVEGIGMDRSVFPFYDWDGPPPCVHGQIRCYSEDGLPLIMSEMECDYEILSVDKQEGSPLFQMNTLVENVIHINFLETPIGKKHVRIADMTGKTIYLQETTDETLSIDLSNKPNGFYLVQIITGSHVINNKVLKR